MTDAPSQSPGWEQWVFFTLTLVRLLKLSCNMLTDNLMKCSLDKQTVKWIENGWNAGLSCDQQLKVELEASLYRRGWYRGQHLLTSSLMTYVAGQTAPPASLRWGNTGRSGWYTRWMFCCSAEKLMGWRNGPTETAWRVTKGNAKLYPWAGGAGCAEEVPRVLWITNWSWASNAALPQRRPTSWTEFQEEHR